VKTFETKIILWLFVSILILLSVLGFAGRAELKANASPMLTGPIGPAAPLPSAGNDQPSQGAYGQPQNPEPASSQSARSGS